MPSKAWTRNRQAKARLDDVIRSIPKAAQLAITDSLAIGGAELTSQMKSDAPIGDTGNLRKSIGWNFGDPAIPGHKPRKKSRTPNHLRISIYAGDRNHSAPAVEFGTDVRTTKDGENRGKVETPRPFFFPNFRAFQKRIRGRISRNGNKAIRRAADRSGLK